MKFPQRQVADPRAQQNFEALELALPKLVTALPSQPADGQEVYYIADSTNGVAWRLRYRTASSSAYRWEFAGGPPLFALIVTSENTASAAYTALATAGPSVTVPLAGDYDVELGSFGQNTGAGVTLHGFDVGGSVAADGETVRGGGAASIQASSSRLARKTGLAASTALVSKYRTTAGTGTWEQRWMRVTPVRVG